MVCERYLHMKTTTVVGFLLILSWILIWGFGDEVKIACFLVFGANTTTYLSFPSTCMVLTSPPQAKGGQFLASRPCLA